jgi:hypothetical protein
LSRRSAAMPLATDLARAKGPVLSTTTCTGLKVYGAGEWQQAKHGRRARRSWRKLHVLIADRARCRGRKLVWSMERHADVIADWARCRRGQ